MSDPELSVGLLAARFDDEYPDAAPEWVADTAVRTLKATDLRRLLADLLKLRIENRRRERARQIEQRAAQDAQYQANREAWEAKQAEQLAPKLKFHDETCGTRHGTDEARRQHAVITWRTSPEGSAAVAERAARHAAAQQRRAEAEAMERLRQEDPEEWRRLNPSPFELLRQHLEDFRDNVRLELTVELLGSDFALGDGRRVTWGYASTDDHHARIALLAQSMEGTGRTMVLHEKAIEMIEARGARCLNDVRWVAA